ncbi:KpsF/GutQ family sugar-phosphate isomerase [Segetibacter sp.]|jgi:arabinose-5-phosphate isomerase|uniref:KpsF/GutQ family sugar-phosphate isomerase n=1 Tax=Segetibacter sp. TaxID=2231182 RepID=UPI002612615D|nr:KpsF/GutQ family sugar-phosphate isomerase [Segetibacter sp.]MCW3081111.1 arabinose 5-phosphate isomerase [Segetibacter sp.]
MDQTLLNTAIRTIELEAEAVAGLAKFINEDFEKAVEIVFKSSGRLVVSGVGKSAIISQKIVATLNSTGTPSLFMHAGDAIHGDLGMIGKEDVVMLISKSGESAEIKVIVPLIKNFGNTLIAVCGNAQSYLVKNCDYFLNTTVNKEACPNNLAPTSSTTAQLVMGDALAICLMQKAGFKGADFARLHPGGNLGKRLYLRVKDLYTFNTKPVVSPTARLKEIIVQITKGRLGATAVVSKEGRITGIITDGDLRRMLEKSDELENIKAEDILTRSPKTVFADELAVTALELLRSNDISQLIVTNENETYLGMLHLHDLVKEGIA